MKTNPIGLYPSIVKMPTDRRKTVENTELRVALEQAVDEADLNVSERLAINEAFFPKGDGFAPIPKDRDILEITTYYNIDGKRSEDDFAHRAFEIAADHGDKIVKENFVLSAKCNRKGNFDKAIEKLSKVIKDWR